MKEIHLSDGAMNAVREDLERGPGGELTAGSKYIGKALDEVLWLRDREARLMARVAELEALVVKLKESCPSWYLSDEAIATLATFPGEQND